MAEPVVWGSLPKAQDDATTIDDAIAAAIAAHEADPTAHLGDGESLETHRANDTIDHPAGSVLADKNTLTEFFLSIDFSNIDLWSQLGDVGNSGYPAANLYVEHGATEKSELYLQIVSPSPFLTKTKDMLMQVVAQMPLDTSHFYALLGFSLTSSSTLVPGDGFGFYVNDGALKAFVVDAGTPSYTAITGVTLSDPHIYRAQLTQAEGKIRFFIDGSQVAEMDVPATDWESDSGPFFGVAVTASNSGDLYISDLNFSRAIVNI